MGKRSRRGLYASLVAWCHAHMHSFETLAHCSYLSAVAVDGHSYSPYAAALLVLVVVQALTHD